MEPAQTRPVDATAVVMSTHVSSGVVAAAPGHHFDQARSAAWPRIAAEMLFVTVQPYFNLCRGLT